MNTSKLVQFPIKVSLNVSELVIKKKTTKKNKNVFMIYFVVVKYLCRRTTKYQSSVASGAPLATFIVVEVEKTEGSCNFFYSVLHYSQATCYLLMKRHVNNCANSTAYIFSLIRTRLQHSF